MVSFLRQRRGATPSQATSVHHQPVPSRKRASMRRLALIAAAATLVTCSSFMFGEVPQQIGERWVLPWLLPLLDTYGIDPFAQRDFHCVNLTLTERLRFMKGDHVPHLPIITNTTKAQTLFDQGLLHAWGFNQLEAIASFRLALEQDPGCAMCMWGLAYARGPNVNRVAGQRNTRYPVYSKEDALEAARDAAQAEELLGQRGPEAGKAAVQESNRRYIEALVLRYSQAEHHPESFVESELAYSAAMRQAGDRDPADATAKALAAEALMNTSPWNYHGNATAPDDSLGQEVERLLQDALRVDPHHALALHLHIHLWEAMPPGGDQKAAGGCSRCAARASASAEKLHKLALPQGHLQHMPSHIFARTGRYVEAVEANTAAWHTDLHHGMRCLAPYLPEHNLNMLVYAAAAAGMFNTAQKHALAMRDVAKKVPRDYVAGGREWVALPLLYVRYGLWDRLVAMRAPKEGARGVTSKGGMEYARFVHAYAKLLSLCSSTQISRAKMGSARPGNTTYDSMHAEVVQQVQWASGNLTWLETLAQRIPQEGSTQPGDGPGLYASGYRTLAGILLHMAQAAVHLLLPDHVMAIDLLKEAVVMQDGMGYYEPARLHQPLRQCLGWVQLAAGRPQDAEVTYRQDLEHAPGNGWALYGMYQAIDRQGRHGTAQEYYSQYEAAFRKADVRLTSSCPQLSNLPFLRTQ